MFTPVEILSAAVVATLADVAVVAIQYIVVVTLILATAHTLTHRLAAAVLAQVVASAVAVVAAVVQVAEASAAAVAVVVALVAEEEAIWVDAGN